VTGWPGPRIPEERIAARSNGDSRRAPGERASAVWRASAVDFASTQAAGQVFRAASPVFRALGFRDAQLIRVAPLAVHLGAIVYRADREIERHQAAGGADAIDDRWSGEILELLETLGIGGAPVLAAVEPLRELVTLETALVRGRATSREDLLRMIALRPLDVELATAVLAEIAGTPASDDLRVPLHGLFVLRDALDDLRSLEEDAGAGSFNCYRVAERLWGTAPARELLDEVVRDADGRISGWIRSASDDAVRGLSVAVAEPVDDAAAADAWRRAAADPEGVRTGLLAHFERGAERGFAAVWDEVDALAPTTAGGAGA
jgi:hypothetical protein